MWYNFSISHHLIDLSPDPGIGISFFLLYGDGLVDIVLNEKSKYFDKKNKIKLYFNMNEYII